MELVLHGGDWYQIVRIRIMIIVMIRKSLYKEEAAGETGNMRTQKSGKGKCKVEQTSDRDSLNSDSLNPP